MAKMTKKQTAKVAKVMGEFKDKKLHGGINPKGPKKAPVVKSRKQAIAIALSEAGSMKKKRGMAAGGITPAVAPTPEQARMRQAFSSQEQYNPQKPQVAMQTATGGVGLPDPRFKGNPNFRGSPSPQQVSQLREKAAQSRAKADASYAKLSPQQQADYQARKQARLQARQMKPTAMPKANPAMGRGMSQSGLSAGVNQAMQDFSKQAATQAPAGPKMMEQPAQAQSAPPGLALPKMAKGGVVKKGMTKGGMVKKGMAKGGVAKKGMASGGMAKKGCK